MALDAYLLAYLGKLNDTLGYTTSDFSTVVSDTLEELGITTETQVDSKILHIVGKYFLWKKILVDISSSIDFSADGASYKYSQMYDFVESQYLDALSFAQKYLTNSPYEITVQNYQITTSGSGVYDEYSQYYPY